MENSSLLQGTSLALNFLLRPYKEIIDPLTSLSEVNKWSQTWNLYKHPQISVDIDIFKEQILRQLAQRMISQATTRSGKTSSLITPWDLQPSGVFPMNIITYDQSLTITISEEMARGILITAPPFITLGISTGETDFYTYTLEELSAIRPFYPYWANIHGQEYNISDDFISGVRLVSDLTGISLVTLIGNVYSRNTDGTTTPYIFASA